ncbi:hypothetical protein GCM10018952_31330 [Streptosporangium vulgare]
MQARGIFAGLPAEATETPVCGVGQEVALLQQGACGVVVADGAVPDHLLAVAGDVEGEERATRLFAGGSGGFYP